MEAYPVRTEICVRGEEKNMIIMYDVYYKDKADEFKETHYHSCVLYRETAVFVCDKLKADGKKPWFQFVKVES